MDSEGANVRYLKFRIRNFKGIQDTELDLTSMTSANVFSLVGLNESGKTTILEAIHSFSPDDRSGSLRGARAKSDAEAAKERVPRHLIARFTGDIVVDATVSLSQEDKHDVIAYMKSEHDIVLDASSIPDTVTISRIDTFSRGDYITTAKILDFAVEGCRKSARKPRILEGDDYQAAYKAFYNFTPDIAYYDSFIFNFPKRIYLTVRPGANDWVYRRMFEDVLAAGRVPYDLKDITRRVRNPKYKKSWVDFFTLWSKDDERQQVQQVIDQATETINEHIFGKWNAIFKEDTQGKRITIEYGVEQGRAYNQESKSYYDTDDHDVWVSLELKHGTRRFPISDRSLGFRWFFAFLLFTQFRTRRQQDRPVLFLFDEPAANLHSAAQGRLIESFPGIATGDNMLMYSTHSHYMISPDWLEQTFIVTNAADSPDASVVASAFIEDDSLNIKAQIYRAFANEHPSDTSYFQPVVDRLEIMPSKFDISLPSIVVEGKSDYYIMRYAQQLLNKDKLRLLPASGSGTFGALISLGASWGTKFIFLLDNDNAGNKERARYAVEHGARFDSLITLDELSPNLTEIESMLDADARSIITATLGAPKLTKKLIARFFQEQLAKREFIPLGKDFEKQSKAMLETLEAKLVAL
jgi:AAA ATPase domain/AAA domain